VVHGRIRWRRTPPAPSFSHPSEGVEMPKSSPRESILVVDDTVENLRLLSNMLAEHEFEIRPVTSARQAIQAVQRDPPDLILLDINMPEMDGYEACLKIKELGYTDIPIIFLTAQTDMPAKVKAFGVGGVDYITKPFQIEEVLARVKAHLALRRARVELQDSYGRLSDLEKLRDDLVKMIVHDMRSPLTSLILRLQLLEETAGPGLPKEDADSLTGAIESASSLNKMANDLLDVSRMESGKFPLERSTTDLVQIAEQVKASMAGLARGRPIDIEASGPCECSCDAAVLKRVLENLVSNAIKHTPSRGHVRIVLLPRDASVRVEVRDQGAGVPVEARAKIFEKFGTLAARQEKAFHSVGLGLAFSKLAVEAHGGTIGVEDGKPAGSVFWFEIPRDAPVVSA
jgi:two-component system sensor histidine kinase/response regulator